MTRQDAFHAHVLSFERELEMAPGPTQFTGIVMTIGAQTFLRISTAPGTTPALLLTGSGPSVAQQIAAATAMFAPVVGTTQTVSGFPTNVLSQFAILVV
jgi:hypothetical protein